MPQKANLEQRAHNWKLSGPCPKKNQVSLQHKSYNAPENIERQKISEVHAQIKTETIGQIRPDRQEILKRNYMTGTPRFRGPITPIFSWVFACQLLISRIQVPNVPKSFIISVANCPHEFFDFSLTSPKFTDNRVQIVLQSSSNLGCRIVPQTFLVWGADFPPKVSPVSVSDDPLKFPDFSGAHLSSNQIKSKEKDANG